MFEPAYFVFKKNYNRNPTKIAFENKQAIFLQLIKTKHASNVSLNSNEMKHLLCPTHGLSLKGEKNCPQHARIFPFFGVTNNLLLIILQDQIVI